MNNRNRVKALKSTIIDCDKQLRLMERIKVDDKDFRTEFGCWVKGKINASMTLKFLKFGPIGRIVQTGNDEVFVLFDAIDVKEYCQKLILEMEPNME